MNTIKVSLFFFFLSALNIQAQVIMENPLPVAFGDPYVLYDGGKRNST
jgi:hypothetical protein